MRDAPRGHLFFAVCLILGLTALACTESDGEPDAAPTPWPAEAWEPATPESQGVDPARLVALDTSIRAGEFGYVDRMLVIRNGRLVIDEVFENDYRTISRGREDALGCGWETCSDPEADLEYNYYHPETHPFYRGREVHSLQSVTKSIAATVLGAALFEGAISNLDAPVLSFFEDYDLSGVEVWAGLGFGGQFLFVLPQRQTIGVVNSWNIFDPPQRDVRGEFLEALIGATSGSATS